jgi:hypothetical protein
MHLREAEEEVRCKEDEFEIRPRVLAAYSAAGMWHMSTVRKHFYTITIPSGTILRVK